MTSRDLTLDLTLKNGRDILLLILTLLNAVYRVSLHGPGAELDRGVTPPPPVLHGKFKPPARRDLRLTGGGLFVAPRLFFFLGGDETLSASKTIAELWDGRLRGILVWSAPPEEGWSPSKEADQEAPMPGQWAPHPGRGYPSGNPQGHPRSGHPSSPCHGDTSPECIGRDRRTEI